MHFFGVHLRDPAVGAAWLDTVDHARRLVISEARLSSWQVGSTHVIADTRLTVSHVSPEGLLVNSGSLLPAGGKYPSGLLADPPELQRFLDDCRGNFAGVHVAAGGERLTLFSDLLGTHPVYYSDLQDAFAFSTSERMLVEMLRGRLGIDTDGLLEICSFGFALGNRTAYREIRCLEAAQILSVNPAGIRTATYFDWRSLDVEPDHDTGALATRTLTAFTEAIECRSRPDARSFTLLSGGMDSRSIAATQTRLGLRPQTISISHPRALDAELARQAADALGCEFAFYAMEHSAFQAIGGVAAAVHDHLARTEAPAPSSSDCVRIWSGDGGSVGMGGVYLSDKMLGDAAAGDFVAVANTFLSENNLSGPSRRLFLPSLEVASFAQRAVLGELARFSTTRRTQVPYLFLLLNDQRRHLHYFYELDLKVPIELATPFWDGAFLRTLLECPDDRLLYHRFYSQFFDLLPQAARQTPWQTYPGHVPCPLPMPEGFEYNWDHAPRPADIADAHARGRRVLRMCTSASFPSTILRRIPTAAAAAAVMVSNDPKRAYLVQQAETVLSCGDRIVEAGGPLRRRTPRGP